MTPTGTALSPAAIARRLALILLASAIAKLIYIFGLTEYTRYVYSDSGHYFYRAKSMLDGNVPYHFDWDVFPMGVTTLLALYWKVLDLMGSYAVLDFLDIGLAIPLFVVNQGQDKGFIQLLKYSRLCELW